MTDNNRVHKVERPSQIDATTAAGRNARAASKAEMQAQMADIISDLRIGVEEDGLQTNLMMLRRADTLDRRLRRGDARPDTNQSSQEEEVDTPQAINAIGEAASEFQQDNPEIDKRTLLSLKGAIEIDDTPDQILEKILRSFPDHYLADETLDFMCKTSDPSTKVGRNLRAARDLLNERFGREVRAGRNITEEAREFAKQGLGTATSLRGLYRDVTGNPREASTLFEELSEAYSFQKMKTVIKFLLHSLGSDLKSKGPSIDPAELQRLFTEVRTMQAILGVYRFFYQRMRLIYSLFVKEDLTCPETLTFEVLAKFFVKLLAERYPSSDKILKLLSLLGLSEELLAKIIILTQYRDAMRGVSPRMFKSDRHRQELLMVLIDTLSELDDLLEDEEEEGGKGYSSQDRIDE